MSFVNKRFSHLFELAWLVSSKSAGNWKLSSNIFLFVKPVASEIHRKKPLGKSSPQQKVRISSTNRFFSTCSQDLYINRAGAGFAFQKLSHSQIYYFLLRKYFPIGFFLSISETALYTIKPVYCSISNFAVPMEQDEPGLKQVENLLFNAKPHYRRLPGPQII